MLQDFVLTEKMAGCIAQRLRNSSFTVKCVNLPGGLSGLGFPGTTTIFLDEPTFKEMGDDVVGTALAENIIHEIVHTCGSLFHSDGLTSAGQHWLGDWFNELFIKRVDPADQWGVWVKDM